MLDLTTLPAHYCDCDVFSPAVTSAGSVKAFSIDMSIDMNKACRARSEYIRPFYDSSKT